MAGGFDFFEEQCVLLKLFCHNTIKKASSNGKITCPNNTVASHCILVCCLHPLPFQKLSSWNKQSADLLLGWGIFFWRLHSPVFTNSKLSRKQGVRSGDFFFFPSQDFRKAMPSQPAGSGKALLKLAAATGKQVYSLSALASHCPPWSATPSSWGTWKAFASQAFLWIPFCPCMA